MLTPKICEVKAIKHETSDIFTLTLENDVQTGGFSFLPGQFNMLYQFGFGEAAISLSGSPSSSNEIVHTIKAVGSLTKSLQQLTPGEFIGVRGPYGTGWPLLKKGGDILIIAGGVGMALMRPALYYLAEHRSEYSHVTLLYGAKTPEEILYISDLHQWKEQGIEIEITVDQRDSNWKGKQGVVTHLIKHYLLNPGGTDAYICGPEIMIHYAAQELLCNDVKEDAIFVSLERHMQCAMGFCGRCQLGPYFLCKDGPVFSYKELKDWLRIKEL